MSIAMQGQLLFPPKVLHALNAIQHLRALYIISAARKHTIWSSCEEIAREIHAPTVSLHRTLGRLVRSGLVEARPGVYGGYAINARALNTTRLNEVLYALGMLLPDNGNTRGSDKLLNAVSDCLNVTLEEFFK